MNKLKQRAAVVKNYLNTLYPVPACELNFQGEFQLLVAVILSAQCTDKRVNQITPVLFTKYKTPLDFANAEPSAIEKIIYSCGFFKQKTKALIQASKDIIEKFESRVPNTLKELTSLRGVGRKTANVILSVAYNKPAIAVDTHVFRVAKRLGLSDKNNVRGVEEDLMRLFDSQDWGRLHYQMVLYGRYHCKARGGEEWLVKFKEYENNFLKENKTEG